MLTEISSELVYQECCPKSTLGVSFKVKTPNGTNSHKKSRDPNQPYPYPKMAHTKFMKPSKLYSEVVFLNLWPKSSVHVSEALKQGNLHKTQTNDPTTNLSILASHKYLGHYKKALNAKKIENQRKWLKGSLQKNHNIFHKHNRNAPIHGKR